MTGKASAPAVREVRDLMNLCAAAAFVGYAQPYAGGMTGHVQDAYSSLAVEIENRSRALGVDESQVWKWYRQIGEHKPLTMADLKPLWPSIEETLKAARPKQGA